MELQVCGAAGALRPVQRLRRGPPPCESTGCRGRSARACSGDRARRPDRADTRRSHSRAPRGHLGGRQGRWASTARKTFAVPLRRYHSPGGPGDREPPARSGGPRQSVGAGTRRRRRRRCPAPAALIQLEHVLHPGAVLRVNLGHAPHFVLPRFERVFVQSPTNGVAREPRMRRQTPRSRRPAGRTSTARGRWAASSTRSRSTALLRSRTTCAVLQAAAPPTGRRPDSPPRTDVSSDRPSRCRRARSGRSSSGTTSVGRERTCARFTAGRGGCRRPPAGQRARSPSSSSTR